jgi:acyl-CoA synthetase (AMP-forming)/AMP-acid ligase II
MSFDYSALRRKWYRDGWFSPVTLIDAFETGAREHGSTSVVFVREQSTAEVTVDQLHSEATALAAALQGLGVRSGDAVAVQLTNRVECAVAYQAVLLCGAVLVPIIHVYGVSEVAFILAESRATVMIMPEQFRSTSYLDRIPEFSRIPTLRHVLVLDGEPREGYLTWPQLDTTRSYERPIPAADDVCLLIYTSGTTSAPKGVQHTHNTVLAEQRTMPALIAGASDSVSLVTFPPGHVAGVGSLFRPLLSGRRTVFLEVWDPARAVELVHEYGVTSTAGAPTHLQDVLELGVAVELTTMREFLVGAAPVSSELGTRAAAAGIATFRSYGSTEHPTVTGEHAGETAWARLNTDGKPLPGSSVRILRADGVDAPIGADGEVVVRGPEQFVGYRDATLNDDAFTADGWFRTGDLGRLDAEGRLTITDRIKDVIVRGGETISSSQVEDVVATHPAVAEVAVLGAPDSRYGERVAVVVVLKPGATLDIGDVQRHVARAGLARQKAPEMLVIADALPRTALGKVRKADVRATHFPRPNAGR